MRSSDYVAAVLPDRPSQDIIASHIPGSRAPGQALALAGRVEYVKKRDGYPVRVIADFLPDERDHFGEQEFGDVRWYPFAPTPEEREFAANLLRSSQRPNAVR